MPTEEQREYFKRYREEHRDQINASARKRYLKNWEKIRARQKEYYQKRKAKKNELLRNRKG